MKFERFQRPIYIRLCLSRDFYFSFPFIAFQPSKTTYPLYRGTLASASAIMSLRSLYELKKYGQFYIPKYLRILLRMRFTYSARTS